MGLNIFSAVLGQPGAALLICPIGGEAGEGVARMLYRGILSPSPWGGAKAWEEYLTMLRQLPDSQGQIVAEIKSAEENLAMIKDGRRQSARD